MQTDTPGIRTLDDDETAAFAVVITGVIGDDGEIVKYPTPAIVSVWPTQVKAKRMAKRQMVRARKYVGYRFGNDFMGDPVCGVREVIIVKPAIRKPKADASVNGTASEGTVPVPEHAGKGREVLEEAAKKTTGRKQK